MKRYSKEWWLKKGLRFELGTCFKRSIEQQHKLAMFCFKRYAEAYHLEKMEEEEDGYFMLATQKGQMIGKGEEQDRILGIIEELAEKSGLRIGEDGKPKPWHLLQKEELIKKIKG